MRAGPYESDQSPMKTGDAGAALKASDAARLPDGRPVFDGYLIGISSRWNGGGYVQVDETPVTYLESKYLES